LNHTNEQERESKMENPKMDKQRFETGMEIRKSVLGREFVEKSFAAADDFNREQQELVTEYCWGAVWGRPGLEKKTRSMLNLAMLSALNRPHELKMHVAGALRNGVTRDEIKEVFLAVMIYAGVPACVDSFRIAREVFVEFDAQYK
jgi:4-carboxymuconolactone decarboxylase